MTLSHQLKDNLNWREHAMRGHLNEILPEPISEQNEKVLFDHLKRKLRSAIGFSVRLLHAMEERFGPAAREVVRDMAMRRDVNPRPGAGDPQTDLRQFCKRLDEACVGSHLWERIADEPDRIAYHYTRCMWAELFRELGEPELGYVICAGDEPAVKSCNPQLAFKRTRVLMKGDDLCDHVFYVEK